MRNFYSLLMCALISFGLSAQSYYVLPNLNAGVNPGNINQDPEFPVGGGIAAGWNTIMASTTTDQWSSAQSIPFSFSFNGSVETSYKVSNTGVLTFSATPGTVPSSTNTALPSGIIPDKSICIWGLNISGIGSDNIVSKTLGTAPNRQHWIQYNSASGGGLPANGWSYWSIVLEETTNNIYIVDQRTANGNVALTVGIQVSTTDYTEVSSGLASLAGNDPTAVDNSYYEFILGTPPNGDVSAIEENVVGVVQPNTPVTIEGLFRNMGVTAISSADFNYTVNSGTAVTDPITPSISSGQSKIVASPTSWTPSTAGVYTVEMWLSNVNGAADPNPANDKVTAKVVVTSTPPERKPFIEERTGTWCQWCPRGLVAMEYMGMNHSETSVLVAVHNSVSSWPDPMTVPHYDQFMSGAFPTFTIDRIDAGLGIGTGSNMEAAHDARRLITPEATLEITNVDLTNNTVSVDVKSKFYTETSNADYRFALIIIEDGVQGTAPGYGQINAYAGGGSGPLIDAKGFDYSTAPSPVPASQMVYHHVAREIYPSYSGAQGSVPTTIAFEDEITYSFSEPLPSSVLNPNHVKVAVILLNQNNGGEVVNADEKKLTNVVSLDELDILEVNVYPNPASDYLNIELYENKDFSVELVNSIGQVVLTDSFTKTDFATINTSNLAKGVYFLKLNAGDQTSTMRIAITK